MRQFLFRVWLPQFNQMIYSDGDLFIRDLDTGRVLGFLQYKFNYSSDIVCRYYKVIEPTTEDPSVLEKDASYFTDDVIQFFLGVYDKNSERLYEGDIVFNLNIGSEIEMKFPRNDITKSFALIGNIFEKTNDKQKI